MHDSPSRPLPDLTHSATPTRLRLRPCIDLRNGRVVQIVGGTLGEGEAGANVVTNFTSERPAAVYARRYRADGLTGGHIISLGPGNEQAALAALSAFPGGMHMGGGITPENAGRYLDAGASHVVVTSYVFREGKLDQGRLDELVRAVGRQRLVLDLSCRLRDGEYVVMTDRWRQFTTLRVDRETLERLGQFCDEFLVHAVDVEGRKAGADVALVERLAAWSPRPVTYAGGVAGWDDVERVQAAGGGRGDLTIGSALDLFGGTMRYRDIVAWQRQER